MSDVTKSATGLVAVTPSDTAELSPPARALWVGGAGDVSITAQDGSTATLSGVSGLLPIMVRRVNATGTTASGIVGLV